MLARLKTSPAEREETRDGGTRMKPGANAAAGTVSRVAHRQSFIVHTSWSDALTYVYYIRILPAAQRAAWNQSIHVVYVYGQSIYLSGDVILG